MLDWWTSKELHGAGFVRERMGSKSFEALLRLRSEGLLNPNQEPSDSDTLGKFRTGGEPHLWMYDRYSLKRLLTEVGFSDFAQVACSSSKIEGLEIFFLDCAADGSQYRPDSLFVEAVRNSTS